MIEQLRGRGRWLCPHQFLPIAALVVLGLGTSGCGGNTALGEDSDTVEHLTASSVYLQSGDRAAAAARLGSLRRTIDELRDLTKSGWTGRQDDVTGYLTELSGGRYVAKSADNAEAVVNSLMDGYGPDLFGITGADLELGEQLTTKGIATATIRATQHVRGVSVLDGTLVFTVGDIDRRPRVHAVRGRVFPGLDVATTPRINADSATGIAKRLSKGAVDAKPTLVVLPTDAGILAWQVPVTGAQDAAGSAAQSSLYFIDAITGDLRDIRPTTAAAHAGASAPYSGVGTYKPAPTDQPVKVTGKDPQGHPLTAEGIRTPEGVKLVDTTVPTYNPDTGVGAIITYTAQDSTKEKDLPGVIYTQPGSSTTIIDPEAIAAHAFSRNVYDYYGRLGWQSWNGKGASLESTVNSEYKYARCNAFFDFASGRMVYGNPCKGGSGSAQLVTIDIAGHEVTHGVTDSSAGLIYAGQSGALNESFSDYFGNVIGNQVKGQDDASISEDSCANVSGPMRFCKPPPENVLPTRENVLAGRYLLNGTTYGDYLRLLTPPWKLELLHPLHDIQDKGGVHLNSAIWNNALWSIRASLARIDDTSMLKSPLVKKFDSIVFHALTTQLVETSGFIDARRAIEDTIVAEGGNPTIGQTARMVFDASGICDACVGNAGLRGTLVASGGATQVQPAVNGDQTIWLELVGYSGQPVRAAGKGKSTPIADTYSPTEVAFAGDAMVALEFGGDGDSVVRYERNGTRTDLGEAKESTLIAGLGGSDQGAAWSVAENGDAVYFVDRQGKISQTRLPDLGDDNVTAVSTGKGTVGLGTNQGRVLLWTPGGEVRQLGETRGAVRVTATYGNRVLAIDEHGTAVLFGADSENPTPLSASASSFGATMNGHYAIWANEVGLLQGGVAKSEGAEYSDTDLFRYSFRTGKIHRLSQRGQQGFPALSGNHLVWQETGQGGDDIRSTSLPNDR